MANEATIQSALQIRVGNVDYNSAPQQHQEDVTNGEGPSPGLVTATLAGVNVDLSALTTPALCRLQNLSSTAGEVVDLGIWDGTEFYPLMEVPPGATYTIRLSRYLGRSMSSGTGTVDTGTYDLRIKSQVDASIKCIVEAFDA